MGEPRLLGSKTMRLLTAMMLALLALAPLASAQEEKTDTSERPSDAAWVDDCPPDMMCAYGGSDDAPTYDGNCGAEVCAYGEEGCIECSGLPEPGRGPADGSCEHCRGDGEVPRDGATCMDGASETEICDRDVQYLDGGNGAPVMEAEDRTAGEKSVPGASVVLVALALALAIFLAARRG